MKIKGYLCRISARVILLQKRTPILKGLLAIKTNKSSLNQSKIEHNDKIGKHTAEKNRKEQNPKQRSENNAIIDHLAVVSYSFRFRIVKKENLPTLSRGMSIAIDRGRYAMFANNLIDK